MTTARSSRRNSRVALLVSLIATAAIATRGVVLLAHRTDEYLQAARIAIEPDRVDIELDMTAGMSVAKAVLAEVDRNGDGTLSAEERGAYGRRVLSALEFKIDGMPLSVQPGAETFATPAAVMRGEGTFRMHFSATLPHLATGSHELLFRNRHRPAHSVYLANALVPETDRIAITTQRRTADQSEITIAFVLRPANRF